MEMNIIALAIIIILFIVVTIIGIIAGRKSKNTQSDTTAELSAVAGRDLSLSVGIFTMAATCVGGGYLSSTTEGIAEYGILWTTFPVTVLLAFTIGGLFFAKPLRSKQYLTLMDPLQERFGDIMTSILIIPMIFAELLWGVTILIALGTSLSVIIEVDVKWAQITAGSLALLYTGLGQMRSVAFTDVFQLLLISVGMLLCIPFAVTNKNVASLSSTSEKWVGKIENFQIAQWLDFYVISQIFGGIPFNTYIMRLLSARSVRQAQIVSFAGGIVGFLFAIPPAILGVVATSADWNATDYGMDPSTVGNGASYLPLVIKNFTPEPVAVVALAAIIAAVMSSMDSIILSSSSMFTRNIYNIAIRKKASTFELKIVQLFAMFVITFVMIIMALFLQSIIDLFYLTADIIYVILFPQLVCSLFFTSTNTIGSFFGFLVGILLRIAGGVSEFKLPPLIKYPFYDEAYGQLFPFKTFTMIISLITIILVSDISKYFPRNNGCNYSRTHNPDSHGSEHASCVTQVSHL